MSRPMMEATGAQFKTFEVLLPFRGGTASPTLLTESQVTGYTLSVCVHSREWFPI